MNKQNFTKGPWKVLEQENGVPYIRVRGTVGGERHKIANVLFEIIDGEEHGAQEAIANAQLIAKSPDMHRVLRFSRKKLQDVVTFLEENPEIEELTAFWDGIECDGGALLDECRCMISEIDEVLED